MWWMDWVLQPINLFVERMMRSIDTNQQKFRAASGLPIARENKRGTGCRVVAADGKREK